MIIESTQSARERLLVLGCLAALILLAFAVRAYDLDGKSIWSDEGLSLYRARKSVPFILSGRIVIQGVTTQDTQPPLYFLLLHGLMAVAGTSTFVAKYLSVLASLLILPLLYVLGRRLVGTATGLFTAFIAALSPLYLWYAQEVRMYTLLVALSVASVYALLRAMDSGRVHVRWGAAYLLVTAAATYTHYSTFFLFAFQALYVLVQALLRRRWRLLAPAGVAGLIALPLLPFVVRRLGTGAERDFNFVPLWIMVRDLWNGFSLGLSVDLYRVYPLGLAFLAAALVGLVALLRQRQEVAAILLGYLFLPILSLYVASYVKPMYQGVRHLMIVSPAYYLLLGVGLAAVLHRSRLAALPIVAVIAVGVALSTSNYFSDPKYLKDDLRGLARYFEEHRGPDDALVLNDAVLTLSFQYYLGEGAPIEALPRFGTPLDPTFPQEIRGWMERYDRLWFMAPHPPIQAWLDRTLFQADEVYFEGMNIPVSVRVYESDDPRLAQAPPGLRSEKITLGRRLRFHGYKMTRAPVEAGEVAAFDLYWEPLQRLGTNYKIALTLADDAGDARGHGDASPFRGLHPTSTWGTDTVLRQRHELAVDPGTPPGEYNLWLKFYDPETGASLTGPAGETRIDLGQVRVERPQERALPSAVSPQVRKGAYFGERLHLLGFDLATEVRQPGDEVLLSTYWQARRVLSADYQLHLRLVGQDGRQLAEKVVSPASADYPTSRWRPGDVLGGQQRLVLPADALPGQATIVLSILDADGRRLTAHRLSWLPVGGREVRLATIEIAPREDVTTDIPPLEHELDTDLGGGISLLGYDLGSDAAASDEAFTVRLYWTTDAVMDRNLKVTVQLLTSGNRVVTQHDSVPGEWEHPTAGWLPGEVIVDPHRLSMGSEIQPGNYRLIAAMYDPVDGGRLTVTQDGESRNYVVLAKIVVLEGGSWSVAPPASR